MTNTMGSHGDEVPVLIAGAGPAGLATAITLARRGVTSLIVERRADRAALPRATSVSTRTMEIMRSWGLERALRDRAVDVRWELLVCETLARAAEGERQGVGYPSPEQSAVISPTTPICLGQDELEPVLLDHLESLDRAHVQWSTTVTDVVETDDCVRVTLRGADGEVRTVRAGYVVAADGAHSAVRSSLGIPMRGRDDLLGVVSAQFRAPLWGTLGEHRYGLYWVTHPGPPGNFLPAGRGDRWIYGVAFDSEREELGDYDEARLVKMIRSAAGVDVLEPRIERIGAFSFAAQLAERFRQGRTFLVGDAAHRVTPRGGTGMNAAVHDGFDLGWKLAWVLHRWARSDLLDTYEAERRPVVEHNAARSIDPNGSVIEVDRALAVDLGDRLPHVWVPHPSGRVSTLDQLGTDLTLFTGPDHAVWTAAAQSAGGPPIVVRTLDAVSARGLGVRGNGALLVRPDGSPAAWWPAADRAARALDDAIATTVSGTAPAAERAVA